MSNLDSRISESPPQKILCQGQYGGCASCCGVLNDIDRKNKNWRKKLESRTQRVNKANFDIASLKEIKKQFLQEHQKEQLYNSIKVCPFAGFIEKDRLGCLIHPSRHPKGQDLRELSVHNRKICEGHFCASHDWLRPTEIAFINTAHGPFYGLLVSQPGLVKQLRKCIESEAGHALSEKVFGTYPKAFQHFWNAIEHWPFKDEDPKRFGGFVFIGQEANPQTQHFPNEWFPSELPKHWSQTLQELETKLETKSDAHQALLYLKKLIQDLVDTISN